MEYRIVWLVSGRVPIFRYLVAEGGDFLGGYSVGLILRLGTIESGSGCGRVEPGWRPTSLIDIFSSDQYGVPNVRATALGRK